MQLKSSFCAISLAVLSLATAQGVWAQAAKSPKMVTKDELRVCMDSEASLAVRRKDMETRKAANSTEIAAINTANVQMAEEQKNIDESNDRKVREFKRKVAAHNDRVKAANVAAESFGKELEAFNKALLAHNDSCGGISYSREDKDEILKEREAAAKK